RTPLLHSRPAGERIGSLSRFRSGTRFLVPRSPPMESRSRPKTLTLASRPLRRFAGVLVLAAAAIFLFDRASELGSPSPSLGVAHGASAENGKSTKGADPADGWRPVQRPDPAPATTSGPRAIRGPLLGLRVEGDVPSGRFRVLDDVRSSTEPKPKVLYEGDRASCEKRFVEILEDRHGTGYLNLPFATLGGKQVWADRFVCCGWRVQENALTGHSRLLDPNDRRLAWGSFEACRVAFERQRLTETIRPKSRKLVVVLHGLFRSRHGFANLTKSLEMAGYHVETVSYPSTRGSLREHADRITEILASFDGFDSVSFVTHSLGGLLIREILARGAPWQERLKPERLVMLAPPNRGSVVAESMKDWLPFRAIVGEVAHDLTPDGVRDLPAPPCEFGVIAGGTGAENGLNPFLPGDNDGTVLVANTKLPGMKDFLRVKALHSFIMENERVIEATVR